MKKIITVYTHKNNGKKFELIPELMQGDKVCLQDMETQDHKFYAPSTLKKNFWKEEVEIDRHVPNEDEFAPGLRANCIRNEFYGIPSVTVKETQSYIGITCGKKSVAQIAFNKKHLTVSVNKDEFYWHLENVENKPEILELVDRCFYKEAPAKYGWRMDFEIDVTDLRNDDIVSIIRTAIEARKNVM